MSDPKLEEREATLYFLRKEAERCRSVAASYRENGSVDAARTWNKLTETIGQIANKIERGEHRGEHRK